MAASLLFLAALPGLALAGAQVPSPSVTATTTTATSVPNSSLSSLSTSAVQTASGTAPTSTTGTAVTTIGTSGNPSSQPFPTSATSATTTVSLVNTQTASVTISPTVSTAVASISASNIFQPIASGAPPPQVFQRSDHPVPRLGIQPQSQKLQTNKFYTNLFLGSQTNPVYAYPYTLSWSKGAGAIKSWGFAVSHTERSQYGYQPAVSGQDAGQWDYFLNPTGIQSMILSAAELVSDTTLTTDTLDAFSVNANLLAPGASSPTISFPLVQGMAFVTGIYHGATPLIQSAIGFLTLTYLGSITSGTYKYRAVLRNGETWLIYVSPSSSSYAVNSFTTTATTNVQGPSGFNGYIQVAKVPLSGASDAETVYDQAGGAYPVAASMTASVIGKAGSYTLSWTKQGNAGQQLLLFALPHHIASMASSTLSGVTDVRLVTTTKGNGTAVLGSSWTLQEPNLPVDMGFAPWTPSTGSVRTVSANAKKLINSVATAELSQNISQQTTTGSFYYDGKALAKFAAIVYAAHDIVGNTTLATTGLSLLETAISGRIGNAKRYPLVYESAWGGVVSGESYVDGNANDDYGNTYYNDHHFHFGYFVYTAAVIGYLDPQWLNKGTNKAWVNMLIRDYANSDKNDAYFPFSRMFDWYHGHSWAAGLFEAIDGKNQESSSEDTMASYAIKMWGRVTGDINMEARGDLMLGIQARSLQSYYLYTSDNTVEPPQYIGNKAAGILFDNKIVHTTYFGTNPEYIEGIHMLPILPFSSLSRTTTFVTQEWNAYFSSTINSITGGWRGILMANYAIINPVAAWNFFSDSAFDVTFLDGGASQTWYMTWSAALGGQ